MVVEIGGIKMEDYELEEGEACFYNTTDDCGGSLDPDNDLSYIDEKLQNILGHFQKDFEGDFSAENLGAKFGGYGSFLPTYQRSPTSAKPQSFARTRSPIILPGEPQNGNAASASVPKKAKSGLSSTKIPTKSMKSKKNSSSRQETTTKKPVLATKQNSFKLRIKMGSDNVSTEKNVAAIYSGLGLDVSPSLSLDNNSLSGSEGMNGEPQGYSLLDSPSSILNVMTFLPVDHSQFLSPLSDDLIHFIERENPKKGYKYTSPSRLFIESSAMTNGLEPEKAGKKPSVEKNRKMVGRNNFSEDRNVGLKKGLLDGTDNTVKESTETKTSYRIAAEKETTSSKLFDSSKENYNGAASGEIVGLERRLWGRTHHKDLGPYHENPKTSSAGSVPEDKNTRFGDDDTSGYSRELGKYKGSKTYDSVKKESSVSKVKSGHKAEPEHYSRKRKSDQIEQEPQSSSKFEEQKSSVVHKKKMNVQAEKKEVTVLKPQNDDKKAKDTYKDFFGDIDDSEEEEERTSSLEVKDLPMSEKGLLALEDIPEKSSLPLADSQNVGPGPILSKLGSDPSLPKANPVIIQEHWVACDKCGKWRLLPFGVLPEDLPEKWMCTMLNWLPGVNYCSVPEDETTKALYAMYQIPAPESQAPIQSNPSGSKPQFNLGDDLKKKKKGFKKIDNGMNKEISRTAETNKKTIQTSARNGIVHNLHGHSDLVDEKRQNNKQKEKGKAVDHHSDESRNLKIDNKRNAELENSTLAKQMKIESFLFPDEPEHGNGRPTSSSGVHAATANQKPKPRVSSKMPNEEGRASDTGNSDSTRGSKRKKLKESRGSQVYSDNENHGRKKARLLKEEKELIFSQGSGKSDKKKMSHSKREYGHVQNLIAVTSSSSKISDSHKPRNSSHQARGSPVESVSSSPMRISNPEKNAYPRKMKGEYYDANIFAADSLKRFPDGEGEDDGGSDRSQTRRKDKHGSHESSVLDVWDNKGSSKTKERAEPSLDANFENGGHKEFPRKPDQKQSSDHHRRSNDSLARMSGKVSSSRSKDKSKSIRSDSRDGPRNFDKKIYNDSPNSRVDMVVRPNIPKPSDVERTIERSNRADLPSPSQPPSRGVQGDSSMISARRKVDKCGISDGNNNIEADDVRKATGQIRRKNEPSPSPLRKEVTSVQAAHNILKEAKDLKHTADRLKNSVSNLEHIELYFQACFKFLHGAYLLETNSNESSRQGEIMVQSMSIYSSTANLCGFCAHEYEKSKDMGAAALAYKCMEAAYMRVVNSSCTSANKYRIELQTSLQMFPTGESPSSSASDVDNVNHPAVADKASTSRGISSPLVAGNHVISAQNRSNILRLLQYAQDVNLAMDASRKSRVALAAAMENLAEEDQQQGEAIVSIKTALDYNFHDIEGLLHLVKLAMKANNR